VLSVVSARWCSIASDVVTPPIHRLLCRVRSYEVDPRGRLQVPILCRLLQEAATEHAADLGVAVEALISTGVAWVLTRLDLTMDSWPSVGDEVVVDTWPAAANRLTTERRFEIFDHHGSRIGSATTLWLVLDLARRRPVRIPATVAEPLSKLGLGDRPVRPDELASPGRVDRELTFAIRRCDLDSAGHVNNTSFVEWAIEAVPDDIWNRSNLERLEVAFLAECHRGQTVVSRAGARPDSEPREVLHQLVRRNDGREVARARTSWSCP
jgi:acyl-ACP thioesterase